MAIYENLCILSPRLSQEAPEEESKKQNTYPFVSGSLVLT